MSDEMRAWVGCLACYGEGTLTGDWVAARDADTARPCDRPDHEELWVMDHEGMTPWVSGECSPEEIAETAARLEEIAGDGRLEVFALWATDNYHHVPEALDNFDAFEDQYLGTYDDAEDWAWETLEDCYGLNELPNWVSRSAVVEAWLHDVKQEGYHEFYDLSDGCTAVMSYI